MATVTLVRESAPPVPDGGRFRSLDGLRGLAAVVVVAHHALLTVPALAAVYYSEPASFDAGRLAWIAAYTPAHLLWAGGEAVYLFFVLSGFVLVLPAGRRGLRWWAVYYPRRLIRLYVPVLAAVGLGYLVVVAVPRVGTPSLGAWVAARPGEISPDAALADITLVAGVSGLISPLWSLQWEVLFSLVLPVFVVLAGTTRVHVALKALAVVLSVTAGALVDFPPAVYLPMFGVGAMMAVEMPRLRRAAARVSGARRPSLVWSCLLVLSLLLLCAQWLVRPITSSAAVSAVLTPLVLLGASVLLFVAAFGPGARRVLESRWCQSLGLTSFSLYLVHEPLLIASSLVLGPDHPWLAIVLGAISAAAATVAFHRLVERPSHAVSRAVGHRVDAIVTRAPRGRTTAAPHGGVAG